MAEGTIKVEIVTPERAAFNEEAEEVVIPGTVGEIGVLPGHLPLLTSIGMGDLAVKYDGDKIRHFFVEGGFAEILPDKVSVLTRACDGVDEIDVADARLALEAAEEKMDALEERARTEEVEGDVRQRHQDALERARKRLLVAGEEGES